MARRRRYKLPASTQRGSGCLYWILTLVLLGGIFWVWRHTSRRTPMPKPPATRPIANPAVEPPVPKSKPVGVRPVLPPTQAARAPRNTFEAQLALMRYGISPGSVDGVMGSQTRAALRAFQRSQGVPQSGALDDDTRSRLLLEDSPVVSYWVSSNDMARLQPVAATWLGKSEQTALDYETILELVAEKTHAHPDFIRQLNPGVNWSNVVAGTELRVPNAAYPEPVERAGFVWISLSSRTLEVFGVRSNLLAHFPCSIAQRVEKRPVGELHVSDIASKPNYTFNPEVFPESTEAQAIGHKLILPPGPNNPVGVAWISLDRAGYGIHGTPSPELVGRTESHGCFRLANWNAEYLLKLVGVGTPVFVEP